MKITLQTPFKIALRIKGTDWVTEGRICEDEELSNDIILIEKDHGGIAGGPVEVIEAVWFLGQWMTPEQFFSYQ